MALSRSSAILVPAMAAALLLAVSADGHVNKKHHARRCHVTDVKYEIEQDAIQFLEDDGCKRAQIRVRRRCAEADSFGIVIAQQPRSNRYVKPGRKVTLTVGINCSDGGPGNDDDGGGGGDVVGDFNGNYYLRFTYVTHFPNGSSSQGQQPAYIQVANGVITSPDLEVDAQVDQDGNAAGTFQFPGFNCRINWAQFTFAADGGVDVTGSFACNGDGGITVSDGQIEGYRY